MRMRRYRVNSLWLLIYKDRVKFFINFGGSKNEILKRVWNKCETAQSYRRHRLANNHIPTTQVNNLPRLAACIFFWNILIFIHEFYLTKTFEVNTRESSTTTNLPLLFPSRFLRLQGMRKKPWTCQTWSKYQLSLYFLMFPEEPWQQKAKFSLKFSTIDKDRGQVRPKAKVLLVEKCCGRLG